MELKPFNGELDDTSVIPTNENAGAQLKPFTGLLDGEEPKDGPLDRGIKNTGFNSKMSAQLVLNDTQGLANTVKEAHEYNQANPGMPEGKKLYDAYEKGDGFWDGVGNTVKQIGDDYTEAKGFIPGVKKIGRDIRAMGEGVITQLPNAVAPMVGTFGGAALGAAAGSEVPVVGNVAGAVVGSLVGGSAGNALVEGGGQVQDGLQKAGIDASDTQAVKAYLDENRGQLLKQTGIKGGVLGVVDTVTGGAAHALLTGPLKSATTRALTALGIDEADHAAVAAAKKSGAIDALVKNDEKYLAAQKGAENIARNAGAAALEPVGEFTGEYFGQGLASDDWDTKNAGLEALSSIGQSAGTFGVQKAIQYGMSQGGAQNATEPSDNPTNPNPANPGPGDGAGVDPLARPDEARGRKQQIQEEIDLIQSKGSDATQEDLDREKRLNQQLMFEEANERIAREKIKVNGQQNLTNNSDGAGQDAINLSEIAGQLPPQKPSERMGLDPNAGALSDAAALSVDSGASGNFFLPGEDVIPWDDPVATKGTEQASPASQWDAMDAAQRASVLTSVDGMSDKNGNPNVIANSLSQLNWHNMPLGAQEKVNGAITANAAAPVSSSMQQQEELQPASTVYADQENQNRDRGRADSLAQMAGIKNDPDYDRLGRSQSPSTGAPMVFAPKETLGGLSVIGHPETVTGSDGRKIQTQYAVVEASELQASHDVSGNQNPVYSSELPAGNLKALNNGRTAGIQAAYTSGNADNYKAALIGDAARLGVDPNAIAAMKQPVLVRTYDEANNNGDMGAWSNASEGLRLSAAEQANNDARVLGDLHDVVLDDDGKFSPTKNMNLIHRFVNSLPSNEASALRKRDGSVNLPAVEKRIQHAMLAIGFNNDDLINAATEDTEQSRNLMSALTQSAAGFAKLPAQAAIGTKRLVVRAAEMYQKARESGTSVEQLGRQQDLMGGYSAHEEAIADYMEKNIRAPKKVAMVLGWLADYENQAHQSQGSMFGDDLEATKDAAIAYANQRIKQEFGNDANTIREQPATARQQPTTDHGRGTGATTGAHEGATERAGRSGGAAFGLTSQTEQQLAEQEAAQAAAKEEAAQREKAAQDKANADAEVGQFTLTGSDRAADVAAAQGQQDIFSGGGKESETPDHATRWQSMSIEDRKAVLKQEGGWPTQSNGLSVIGQQLAQQDWSKLPSGMRDKIQGLMDKTESSQQKTQPAPKQNPETKAVLEEKPEAVQQKANDILREGFSDEQYRMDSMQTRQKIADKLKSAQVSDEKGIKALTQLWMARVVVGAKQLNMLPSEYYSRFMEGEIKRGEDPDDDSSHLYSEKDDAFGGLSSEQVALLESLGLLSKPQQEVFRELGENQWGERYVRPDGYRSGKTGTDSETQERGEKHQFLSNFDPDVAGRGSALARAGVLAEIRKLSERVSDILQGRVTKTRSEILSPLGPFKGYEVRASIDRDGASKTLHVKVYGKEQIEAGLTGEPALLFTVSENGEFIVNGPSPNGETFREFQKRGWAEHAHDKAGNVEPDYTRLTPTPGHKTMPMDQLKPLLADVHARVRAWRKEDQVGLYWVRSTGATGGVLGRETAVFFQKGKGTKQGAVNPTTKDITLSEKDSDASTFLHETGHIFLETQIDMAGMENAGAVVKHDADTVLKWFGIAGNTMQERLAAWNAMTLEEKRQFHEQYAESFEQYLMEGKAPSKDLQSAFDNFRRWLKQVYKSIKAFLASHEGAKLNDDVRAVFDRLLATEEQIQEMEKARNAKALAGEKPLLANPAETKAFEEAAQTVVDNVASGNTEIGKAKEPASILNTSQSKYIAAQAKEQGIKKGSPGYDAAIKKLEAAYGEDLNKALAALPFEQFHEWNVKDGSKSENMNRKAWEALREEYGIEDVASSKVEQTTAPKQDGRDDGVGAEITISKEIAVRYRNSKQSEPINGTGWILHDNNITNNGSVQLVSANRSVIRNLNYDEKSGADHRRAVVRAIAWAQENDDKFDAPKGELESAPIFNNQKKEQETKQETKPTPATNKLEDFGEKLEGARKDYAQKLKEAKTADVAAVPLSQSWPEPNYDKLLKGGADPLMVGFVRALREELPSKPKKGWKLNGWVDKVKSLRFFAEDLLSGEIAPDNLVQTLNPKNEKETITGRIATGLLGKAEMYKALGHETSLKDVEMRVGTFDAFMGESYSPAKRVYYVEKDKRTPVAWGKTLEEAVSAFVKKQSESSTTNSEKKTEFGLWREAYSGQYFWGKKLGKNYVKLARFNTLEEAKAYKKTEGFQEEMEALLERYKTIPFERRRENAPRVGDDHRNGAAVTPEAFSEAFKFRGVQFGNYVESSRRQRDLDNAYDALSDLAAALGIPTQAISLNGKLGLAFGARGKGGKNAAAAHFEPAKVVINLTKESGAGSLAHEWFHAMDNYFAKLDGGTGNFVTNGDVNPLVPNIRPEVLEAFNNVIKAINDSGMLKRAKQLDARKSKDYWSGREEMAARAFESYIIGKLHEQNAANDYLANIVGEDYWKADEALAGHENADTYPYPTVSEMESIGKAFDHLFDTIQTKEGDDGNVALFNRNGNDAESQQELRDEKEQTFASGLHHNLPAEETTASRTLENKINEWRARRGDIGRVRVREVSAVSLPKQLHRALARFTDTTGTRVVLFRNLTPEVDDFGGVNFRDGTLYINENSQNPITLTAAHEWVHNLKKTNPSAYQELENEVRRQGRLDAWHERNIKEEGFDRGRDHAIEELTAAAVSDALTDPVFLQKLAERDQSAFRRIAKAFLEFLKTLTTSWKDQGSNAYLQDVEAFRDKLVQVLDELPVAKQKPGVIKALFLRVFHEFADTEKAYGGEAAYEKAKPSTNTPTITESDLLPLMGKAMGSETLAKVLLDSGLVTGVHGEAALRQLAAQHNGAKFMVAWHGTPHDFDQFSLDKIGTGEGAQAYGYGLYFAGSRSVAEWYKRNLSGVAGAYKPKGLNVTAWWDQARTLYPDSKAKQEAWHALAQKDDWSDLDAVLKWGKYNAYSDAARDAVESVIQDIYTPGALYQVELAPTEDEYLDWDKPLIAQSEKVKAALRSMDNRVTFGKDRKSVKQWIKITGDIPPEMRAMTGGALYSHIAGKLNARHDSPKTGSQQASEYLHSIGIRGIKYLDGSSRSAGESNSNSNYVIFDDTDISIINKYSQQGQIQGVTLPDGRIILNLDALTADNFAGVFKHEGFHSTVKTLLGEAKYNQLMKQLESQVGSAKGNTWVDQANAAVPADTKAAHKTEEIAAYAIEQVTNGAKVPGFINRWVGELLSAIRTAIIRFAKTDSKLQGWAMQNLNPEDLARLAVVGLRAKARGAMQGQMREAVAYSKQEADADRQFKETDRAYGGREAYDRAKASGKTKLNYRQWVQVRTPRFKEWFGDWEGDPANASKAVDNKTGEPMVVYHGTDADFSRFNLNKLGANTIGHASSPELEQTARIGHWFNTSPTGRSPERYGAGYSVDMPVYLRLEAPLTVRSLDELEHMLRGKKGASLRRELESDGYDGVIVESDEEFGGTSYIAFRPNQIKSAIGNNGAFDGSNPNILRQNKKQKNKDSNAPRTLESMGVLSDDGILPELVAGYFGMETEQLIRGLLDTPELGNIKQAIENMTDQIMLERHADLATPEAMAEATLKAVMNKARAKFVATEYAILAKAAGGARATEKQAKEYAQRVIGETKVKDIKPEKFIAAAAKAGKEAQKAMAKSDTKAALLAKRNQVLNEAVARMAVDVKDEVKKFDDLAAKIIKATNEKNAKRGRDPDMVNAITAVMGFYGFYPSRQQNAMEYLERVREHDPDMFLRLQDAVNRAAVNQKDFNDLTINEMRGLREEIEGLWYTAKRSRQMEIDGKKIDLQEAADGLVTRLLEVGLPDEKLGAKNAPTEKDLLTHKLKTAGAWLSRVEQWAERMDGQWGGAFTRYIFQPVKKAADRYRTEATEYNRRYVALIDALPKMKRGLIAAPELGYTFGAGDQKVGMAELLHAVLHTGNASNKRKLLLGRGWAVLREDGSLDTARWDVFVERMHKQGVLKKEHYDFAQGVWDLLEDTKAGAQKTHRDVFGYYFAEVTADAFDTPFGSYRGGYVPAQADPRLVVDAAQRAMAEEENNTLVNAFPATAKGFTKGRTEYNKPLMLDLQSLAQHINKVLLFTHMEPAVRDVKKLLMRNDVAETLGAVDRAAYDSMLTPWLSVAARQSVNTPVTGDAGISNAVNIARNNTGMALMAANLSNAMQQITGFLTATQKVKGKYILRETASFLARPREYANEVRAASEYMAVRMDAEIHAINSQLNELLIAPTAYQKTKAFAARHAYFLQAMMDNTMSPIIWRATFNQGVEQGMTDADAEQYANAAIRQTQGSSLPEDVSRVEVGGAFWRATMQFYGYFNSMVNTNVVAVKNAKTKSEAMGHIIYGAILPAIVAQSIAVAMRGGVDDDDYDGWLDDWITEVAGTGLFRYATAMVPVVGAFVNLAVGYTTKTPVDDRMQTSATTSMISSALRSVNSVPDAITGNGKPSKAIKDVAAGISLFTGLPVFALARPVGYAADVAAGEVVPTSGGDMTRGLLTGTASPDSK